MTQRSQLWRGLAMSFLVQLASALVISTASADNDQCSAQAPRVGFIVSKTQNVHVIPKGGRVNDARIYSPVSDFTDQNTKRYVCEGDTIQTESNSKAAIELFNLTQPESPNIQITIEPNSVFTIDNPAAILEPIRTVPPIQKVSGSAFTSFDSAIEYCEQTINRAWLFLKQGAIHLLTQEPQSLNVNTPYMNASVEGTEFTVVVGAENVDGQPLGSNTTLVSVLEGKVGVCNERGYGKLNRNQAAFARQGTAPELITVKPDNAVHWALYYPRLNPNVPNPNPKAVEAYDLLISGRVDQALAIIQNETDDFSEALKITAAVTQNDRDLARDKANEAAVKYPDSAPVLLAKSYSQQADFDLKGAMESVEKASIQDPDSIIILTRLAELQQINGQTEEAKISAQRAVDTDPISRSYTVLGFIELSQFNIKEAKENFNKAIADDEYDPLPRLGLGLVSIRKNEIETGLENMAHAVILDPLNSLMRSYFGKTYTEVSQSGQALAQYQLAEDLDSKDPTPNLYRAFLYQSTNQPTKALADLQESIGKNDNRAVYRSSPNLDEDLATRSASAARIYDELGFDQLTVLEGAKSLAHDPGNYSAHRLMADAYLNRPRHEIARVSELLQSQIRQPLNNNPAQVQLADSRLGAFRDSGPFDVSFNEFSRLYTKEGLSGRVGLLAGENNTHGEEVQISNLTGSTSFAVTGYNFETDNFRLNEDEDNDLFNLFIQHQLNDQTSLQAEYRDINVNSGETYRGFDPEDFDPNLRADIESKSYRFSVLHNIDASQELLFNYKNEKLDEFFPNLNDGPDFEFDRTTNSDSDQFETQYVKSSEYFDLISGFTDLNQQSIDRDFTETEILFDADVQIDHRNYYAYIYPHYKNLDFTFGVSYDDFSGDVAEINETNPKFGLTYNFGTNNTIRLVALDSFKRSLLSDQTLEPTNIAGFNQFFDDANAAQSRLYGLGFDRVFNFDSTSISKLYAGTELTRRQIDVPVIQDFETVEVGKIEERMARVYFYIPYSKWSFGLTLEKEIFDRELFFEGPEQIIDLRIKRAIFSIKYFDESGLGFSLNPQYIDQDAELIDRFFAEYFGEDSFWAVDASVRYLIPSEYLPTNLSGLFQLDVKNIFDKEFNYQDTDPFNSRIEPERAVYLNIRFSF